MQKRFGRSRRHKQWSSSMLGTHAQPRTVNSQNKTGSFKSQGSTYTKRRSARNLDDRTAEINQVRPRASMADEERPRRSNRNNSHTQAVLKRQRYVRIAAIAAIAAIILAIAVGLGSCVFQASVTGNMSLKDADAKKALTPVVEDEPQYILLAGLNEESKGGTTASFLSLLRVNPDGGRMTLLNIPSNMMLRYNGTDTMIREVTKTGSDADVIKAVQTKLDVPVNHYVRITDTGFVQLVDAVGGIEVDVTTRVDDPRVSTIVIDPGLQVLQGEQALTFVSAFSYTDDRTTRAANQAQAILALANKITAEAGFGFMNIADTLSGEIETDMNYQELENLAQLYGEADPFTCAIVPGSQGVDGDLTVFYLSSSNWPIIKELFENGEEPVISVDTTGVSKASVTIEVLNGSGVDGLALQAAQLLEAAGWTVSDTGNADSYVYDETLVVYRTEDDKAAAQAIVDELGVGRIVYSSVYYKLSTNVQVIVGKDWQVLN